MRYIVLLVLSMTAFFTYAQSVNNSQPKIAAVNPQSDSPSSPSGGNDLLGLPSVPIPGKQSANSRQNSIGR